WIPVEPESGEPRGSARQSPADWSCTGPGWRAVRERRCRRPHLQDRVYWNEVEVPCDISPSQSAAMTDSRLHSLHAAGVSIWLDYIERTMLRNGELARRIRDDALMGMTSNPTIFEKALAEGTAYDDQIRSAPGDFTAMELFELIATTDVRDACDQFRGVYDSTSGRDGFVSIEVSPASANDARATISEAQRLWATVDRSNVFVKVPGTVDGATAVRHLIAAGVNVNITLLFSLEAYARVIDAYM